MKYLIAILTAVLFVVPANARPAHHYICGATQAAYFGLPVSKFALALNWATYLPHTEAHAGAVVVQRRGGRALGGGPGGHVSRIVQMIDRCSAVVSDESGTYTRDICRNLVAYVQPNGG